MPGLDSIWDLYEGCEFFELATQKKHLATNDFAKENFYRNNDKGFCDSGDPFIIVVEGYLTEQAIVVDDAKSTNHLIVAVLWEGWDFLTNSTIVYYTDIRNLKRLQGIAVDNNRTRKLIPHLVKSLDFCK